MTERVPYLHKNKVKDKTYWRYKLPDGSYRNLGEDYETAARIARRTNIERQAKEAERRARFKSVTAVIEFYRPVKLSNTNSEKSCYEINRRLNNIAKWIGKRDVATVEVVELDEVLAEQAPGYEPYRMYRLTLIELFDVAISKGWRRQIDGNPARALILPKLSGREKKRKQRQRMTDAQFWAIHAECPEWLQVAIELMYIYGIRRSDLCALKVDNFHDGYLHFIPQKTADLPDPAALKLRLTDKAKTLVSISKQLPPLCPYFVHRKNSYRGKEAETRDHPAQVLPEQLNRHFAKYRERAMIKHPNLFPGLSPDDKAKLPGTHEIRSLCGRNLEAKGWTRPQIQRLYGHADEETTQIYLTDPTKVKWQIVEL